MNVVSNSLVNKHQSNQCDPYVWDIHVYYFHKHDDVIKWKHFPCCWPSVRGIHRSPMNSIHKAQWRGALMFSLICAWTNDWVNNRYARDLQRHRARYDVTVINMATVWIYFILYWICFMMFSVSIVVCLYSARLIHRHWSNHTGTIVWLPQCRWSSSAELLPHCQWCNPEGYG